MDDTASSWRATMQAWDPRLAPAVAARWGGAAASVTLVSDGINILYRVEIDGLGHYLRIMNGSGQSYAAVESAVDYQDHLFRCGAPVCAAAPSRSGDLVEQVRVDGHTFFASMVAELPGEVLALDDPGPEMIRQWGRALGLMHDAAAGYRPGPGRTFKTWAGIWDRIGQALPADARVRREYAWLNDWHNGLTGDEGDFGLTHADFRAGNATWDGSTVHVFDFDEPVYTWFTADIARAVRNLSHLPDRMELRDGFIRGYRSARPLDDRWVDQLTMFMRMKDLDIYVWSLDDGELVDTRPTSHDGFLAEIAAGRFRPLSW